MNIYDIIKKHCDNSTKTPGAIGYIELIKLSGLPAVQVRDELNKLTTDKKVQFYEGINEMYFYV